MWFGSLVVLTGQMELHVVQDGPPFVYQGEIGWFGGGDYAHPVLARKYVQRLQDTLDLDVFYPQVFLVVGVTGLALPPDGLLVDTCRYGLGPGGLSLDYVPEGLVSITSALDSVPAHAIPMRLLSRRVSIAWPASGNSKERPVIFS